MCEILTTWGEDVHPALHEEPSVVAEVLQAMESVAEGLQNCPGRGFFTDEDWRRLPVAIHGDAEVVRKAIELRFVRDFEEDVPEALWGNFSVVRSVIAFASTSFARNAWRRLLETSFLNDSFTGWQIYELTTEAMGRRDILVDFEQDIPPALHTDPDLVERALRHPEIVFPVDGWNRLVPDEIRSRIDADLVGVAIHRGFLTQWRRDVPEQHRSEPLIVKAALYAPTMAFTVEDWRSLPASLRDDFFCVDQAIRQGFLTQWKRDVPKRLRKNRLIIGTALETRTMAFAEEDWRRLQTYVDEELLAKARAARDDSAR